MSKVFRYKKVLTFLIIVFLIITSTLNVYASDALQITSSNQTIDDIDINSAEFKQYLYEIARGYYGISKVAEYGSYYIAKGYESDVAYKYAMRNVEQIEQGIELEMVTLEGLEDFFVHVAQGLFNTFVGLPEPQKIKVMDHYHPHYQNFSKYTILPFDEETQKANEALAKKLSEYLIQPKNLPGQQFNFSGSNGAGLLANFMGQDSSGSGRTLYIPSDNTNSRYDFASFISYAEAYEYPYILYVEVQSYTNSDISGHFFNSDKPMTLSVIQETLYGQGYEETLHAYNILIHGLSKNSRYLYLSKDGETSLHSLYNDLYDYSYSEKNDTGHFLPNGDLKSIEQIEAEMDTVSIFSKYRGDSLGYTINTETFYVTQSLTPIVMPPYPEFTDDLKMKPYDIVVPNLPNDLKLLPIDQDYRNKIIEILTNGKKPVNTDNPDEPGNTDNPDYSDYEKQWWDGLIDFSENMLQALKDTFITPFEFIIDLLGDLLDFIINFIKNFLDLLLKLILKLFTLDDDYFTKKLYGYKLSIETKLNPGKDEFSKLLSVGEYDFDDVRGELFIPSASNGSTRLINRASGSGGYVYVNFQAMRDNIPQFRKWVNGFFDILLVIFNMNQILFLIRRTYPINTGGGESDD